VRELGEGGYPVAMFDRTHYASAHVKLNPGDVLFCYTDGLTEALDPSEKEFGKDRLVDAVRNAAGQTAREILRRLHKEIRKFTREALQHDDITAFVIKVNG
jgi:sigma-B regulation protein RsbU (phosphoserine phosphatase)